MENVAMRALRLRAGVVAASVPIEVELIIAAGICAEGRCVLLAYFADRNHSPRSAFPDDTEYEAFVNHFHIDADSVEDAYRRGSAAVDALLGLLGANVDRGCRVVMSVDIADASASVRFFVRREAEPDWVSGDLEGYGAEPVLVVDHVSTRGG